MTPEWAKHHARILSSMYTTVYTTTGGRMKRDENWGWWDHEDNCAQCKGLGEFGGHELFVHIAEEPNNLTMPHQLVAKNRRSGSVRRVWAYDIAEFSKSKRGVPAYWQHALVRAVVAGYVSEGEAGGVL